MFPNIMMKGISMTLNGIKKTKQNVTLEKDT